MVVAGEMGPTQRRALVVDDDAQVAQAVAEYFRREGYDAEPLPPSRKLSEAVAEQAPDILVLDLSLGQNDAVNVLGDLARLGFSGSVMLLSGHSAATIKRVHDIGIGKGLTMLPPLLKPVDRDALRKVLSSEAETEPPKPVPVVFDLDEALRNNWIEVWYQPQVRLSRSSLRGAEALVRLHHPERGIIAPANFLPSSSADAMEELTRFVVQSVARDLRQMQTEGFRVPISINAGIGFIQKPGFLELLRETWPDPKSRDTITVEVTEDEIIRDPSAAANIATQLKLYDVNLAVDDFGSGYTSFSTLRTVPFSELKLDRSFVTGAHASPVDRAFCASVAKLARSLGMLGVAEGIETAQDLQMAQEAGFDIGQGYYFARPRPLANFVELLRNRQAR